jgi:hypothetical protein
MKESGGEELVALKKEYPCHYLPMPNPLVNKD